MKIEVWDEMNDEPALVQFFGAQELRAVLEDYAATTALLTKHQKDASGSPPATCLGR